jgi:hypothetical protein
LLTSLLSFLHYPSYIIIFFRFSLQFYMLIPWSFLSFPLLQFSRFFLHHSSYNSFNFITIPL